MVYFFHRAGQYLRVEGCIVYELEITAPDGATAVERFSAGEAMTERECALQEELRKEGWDGPHGRRV